VAKTKQAVAKSNSIMSPNQERRVSVAALLARAEAALSNRDALEAERIARRVLRTDARHVAALEVLARAQWQQNRFEDLIASTTRLIRLDPYEPGYRLLQGAAYQCLGRFGDATRAYASIPPDVPEHSRSMQLVSELRQWQSSLVSTLLDEDPVFRAEYARDPRGACQSRGFEFLQTQDGRARESLTAAARPS
jgi:hypothetical protein